MCRVWNLLSKGLLIWKMKQEEDYMMMINITPIIGVKQNQVSYPLCTFFKKQKRNKSHDKVWILSSWLKISGSSSKEQRSIVQKCLFWKTFVMKNGQKSFAVNLISGFYVLFWVTAQSHAHCTPLFWTNWWTDCTDSNT